MSDFSASTRLRVTRDHFVAATGREPEHDDLERCNCAAAGTVGHWFCGWDDSRDLPVFESDNTVRRLARIQAMAAYRDDRCEARRCDYCRTFYRGPALYCSLQCAMNDA